MKIEFTENLKGEATTSSGLSDTVILSNLRISLNVNAFSLIGATANIKGGALQIAQKLYSVDSGRFQYFVSTESGYRMYYKLKLKEMGPTASNAAFEFEGEKILKPSRNFILTALAIWPQTTTVYFKVTDNKSSLPIATGLIKISVFSFIRQALSFRVDQAQTKISAMVETARFLKKFSLALIRIYFLN